MKLYFGRDQQGENVMLDLAEENIHFILLAGDQDAGKTFFHRSLYHDLMHDQSPSTLRFLFVDPEGQDTREWTHSPFLFAPVAHQAEEAFASLEEVAEEAEKRLFSIPGAFATIIVHIEENSLLKADRERLEKILDRILANKKTNNIFIFYSVTQIDPQVLVSWLKKFVDLRVIFRVDDNRMAKLLSENLDPTKLKQAGEHILLYRGKRIRCAPFQKISQYL